MPELTIDGQHVEVPPGATILDAARKLGIDVPSLCFLEGYAPSTSCLVCMVKIVGQNRLVPSCGTQVVDGMEIESQTEEIHQVRKSALELLFSDHVGDCLAPCFFLCPAHMDIPLMLRQIHTEDLADAIVTVKNDIALPAVLGRICPKPCEKGCRRGSADGPVAICTLKRYVADVDLASEHPYLPDRKPATGWRVAIVGAGPTGLSAAYYLTRAGHDATIFDDQQRPGGRLRRETTEEELPRDVLDAEIDQILKLGVDLRLGTPVGDEPSLEELVDQFDAVLISCGAVEEEDVRRFGLEASARGIQVNKATFETEIKGVFAAGEAIRRKCLVVRSVADGKEVAHAIDQYLTEGLVRPSDKPLSIKMGRLKDGEMSDLLTLAGQVPRRDPSAPDGGFLHDEAVEQAGRCMHCDCRALHTCKLRQYAVEYGADINRYKGERASFEHDVRHSQVIYEPGKCINCGLCIAIASRAGEPLGLTFVGRGFDVRVGVPLNRSMAEALGKAAADCVAACPTAALSLRKKSDPSQPPIHPTCL